MPTSYQPLADFLRGQPPATVTVTLTIAEVEALVGVPLPVSAWARTWWSNAPQGRRAEARPWVTAGWRVSRTDMRSATPTVTFMRDRSDSTA